MLGIVIRVFISTLLVVIGYRALTGSEITSANVLIAFGAAFLGEIFIVQMWYRRGSKR